MRKVFLIIILLLAFVVSVAAITDTSRRGCEGVVAVINPGYVVDAASPPDSLASSSNIAIGSTTNSWTLSGESSTLALGEELRDQPAKVLGNRHTRQQVTVLKLPLTGQQIS